MYVTYGTLDLVGCKFLGNSAGNGDYAEGDDITYRGATVNIDGCPTGSSGAVGAALVTYNAWGSGTIFGGAKSYSCDSCVR